MSTSTGCCVFRVCGEVFFFIIGGKSWLEDFPVTMKMISLMIKTGKLVDGNPKGSGRITVDESADEANRVLSHSVALLRRRWTGTVFPCTLAMGVNNSLQPR